MGSLTELLTSAHQTIDYNKEAQQYLIEFILFQGHYDFKELAELLGVSPLLLSQVACGKDIFNKEIATRLITWFLVLISD